MTRRTKFPPHGLWLDEGLRFGECLPKGMMRAALAGAVVAASLLVLSGPAAALCASPPADPGELPVLFEGRLLERLSPSVTGDGPPHPNFRWIVDRPFNGARAGQLIEIVMAVPEEREGKVAVSSIDIGPAPKVGYRYLVGAYPGEGPASEVLFTNACGGALELLSSAPVVQAGVMEDQGFPASSETGRAGIWIAIAAVLALSATGWLATHRRRAGTD